MTRPDLEALSESFIASSRVIPTEIGYGCVYRAEVKVSGLVLFAHRVAAHERARIVKILAMKAAMAEGVVTRDTLLFICRELEADR